MEIKTRNVNTAFNTMVRLFQTKEYQSEDGAWGRLAGAKAPIISRPSRNGPVLQLDEPCTITYERPTERVLFNQARDANPFFHLYESLWMLAGRNDVAPLAYYAKQMKEYSDDGGTLNGAYGYRWRRTGAWVGPFQEDHEWTDVDQLKVVIAHLKADPTSRRAVLQMWNVEDDLLKVDTSRDVCCNLSVLFSVREDPTTLDDDAGSLKLLDMTVFNRSNDLIWGALGANAVHFSVLQEYIAAQLDCEVGRYNQISNNMHVYLNNFKPEEWLAYYDSDEETEYVPACNIVPLIRDPAAFDRQLPLIVSHFDGSEQDGSIGTDKITEPFLWNVARPMLRAFSMHKRGRTQDAIGVLEEQVEADDWRKAATDWMEKRAKKQVVKST